MTCLQLALDDPDLETAVIRARELADLVDIVEVGTPLVIEYGMEAVRRLREGCPGVEILADLKIMDAGRLEASLAFAAGASWVTVLGMAHDKTIRAALAAAAGSAAPISSSEPVNSRRRKSTCSASMPPGTPRRPEPIRSPISLRCWKSSNPGGRRSRAGSPPRRCRRCGNSARQSS